MPKKQPVQRAKNQKFPPLVVEIAKSYDSEPMTWKEYPDHLAIVLVDGRKIIVHNDDLPPVGPQVKPPPADKKPAPSRRKRGKS